jgi:hypothetical protein
MNRLSAAIRLLSPTCREAAARLSLAMDRDLSRAERIGLVLHLAICTSCRRFGRHLDFIRRAIVRASASPAIDDAAPRLSDAARSRIRRAVEGQAGRN